LSKSQRAIFLRAEAGPVGFFNAGAELATQLDRTIAAA